MKLRARALALLVLAAAATTTARAGVLEEVNVSGWIVGAYTDNRTGQFSHCATSVPYQSGISLLFHLTRDYRWTMGLANPQWRHSAGQSFNLIYYIDAGPQTSVRALVTQTGMLSIPLTDSRALFETFQRGSRLYVRDSRETFTFNLSNSGKALAATLSCVQRHAHSAPTPAPQGPGAQGPNSQDNQFRAEAAMLAANVLSASGIRGFRVLPRDQIPPEAARFDAVWTADDGLLGMVTIVTPRTSSTVEDVVASLTALDSKDCKGAFSSGRYPTESTGVGRLVTLCQGSNFPEVQYTVANRRQGGFYVLGVTGRGVSSGAVLDAGTKLYDVALRAIAGR